MEFKNIIKIKSGLVEKINPLLKSKLSDFLGIGSFYRDENNNIFTVDNGYVEKIFNMKQFVLIITKDNQELLENSKYGAYVRIGGSRSGLIEYYSEETKNNSTATNLKIIYYDNYIQTYLSYDNMKTWIATGGGQNVKQTDTFGLFVEGESNLIVTDFKIYDNPYVKFLNIPNDYLIKVYDKENKIVNQKQSIYGVVDLYLHTPIKNGYFVIYDKNETELYRSERLDIDLGDVFDDLEYELEVYYLNELLERYITTPIVNNKNAILYVKNISKKDYNNINVRVIPDLSNIDDIQISLNNINFSDNLIIENLPANEVVELYLKIDKNKLSSNFGKKFFDIEFS